MQMEACTSTPGHGLSSELVELRILLLGWLQDGDVGISVLPPWEEIAVGGGGPGCGQYRLLRLDLSAPAAKRASYVTASVTACRSVR